MTMESPVSIYLQQKSNADSLRRKLRFPVVHGYNLPVAVDLRPWMTEIEDQGDMGSCVANAIAGELYLITESIFSRYFYFRCSRISLPTFYW